MDNHEGKAFGPDNMPETLERNDLTACSFQGCDLTAVPLSGARFHDCVFEDCNLSNVRMTSVSLDKVRFKGCKMTGVDFSPCDKLLVNAGFENCVLGFAIFKKLPLRETVFRDCEMKEADFSEADLASAVFAGCDLSRAVFGRTNLEKADLRSARNYVIDPLKNRIRKAKFSWPGVLGLLAGFGIVISDPDDSAN